MKKIIVLLLSAYALFSCSNEDVVSDNTEEFQTRSVTFSLSGIANQDFNVATRAVTATAIDFTKYTVKCYLFKKGTSGNDYIFERVADVTTSQFSITDLTILTSYKYAFVAVSKGFEYMLEAKDSKEWKYNATYPVSAAAAAGTTLFKNFYFPFIENEDKASTLWEEYPSYYDLPETNKNLEIFGQGYVISASMEFHNPVDILLERQYGSVEIRLKNVSAGTAVSAEIPSNYYRIYLSQMVKADVKDDYRSSNTGWISGKKGDYATTTLSAALPFKKAETTTSTEHILRLNLPYTTAAKVGSTVTDDEQKANSITLTVGGSTSVKYAAKFPVYRNGLTYFIRKGDQLAIEFAASADGTPGIDLEEGWN